MNSNSAMVALILRLSLTIAASHSNTVRPRDPVLKASDMRSSANFWTFRPSIVAQRRSFWPSSSESFILICIGAICYFGGTRASQARIFE